MQESNYTDKLKLYVLSNHGLGKLARDMPVIMRSGKLEDLCLIFGRDPNASRAMASWRSSSIALSMYLNSE